MHRVLPPGAEQQAERLVVEIEQARLRAQAAYATARREVIDRLPEGRVDRAALSPEELRILDAALDADREVSRLREELFALVHDARLEVS